MTARGQTVVDFGAVGDGIADDSAAFQAAIASGRVIVPPVPASSRGYMIRSPLNATNLPALTIEGSGFSAPIGATAYLVPNGMSTILGGTGGVVLDLAGSNSVTMRGFNVSSLGVSATPSTVGIVGGTSAATPTGGNAYVFDGVAVCMANVGVSVPVYLNNANLCRFPGLWTIGKYGLVLCSHNVLGVTPPYAAWGPIIESDGNQAGALYLAGYGDGPVLWLEGVNSSAFGETYTSYAGGAAGKSAFSGAGYAIRITNCADVDLKIGCDYFPYVFFMDGVCNKVNISGVTCPDTNQPASGVPGIGFFGGQAVKNSRFDIIPIGGFAHQPYLYQTYGSAMASFANCGFLFDTATTPNVAAFAMAGGGVPFYNLTFTGNADNPGLSFTPAAPSNMRYSVNGKTFGIA